MTEPTLEHLTQIAARYGFAAPAVVPAPWIGATSRVYPCGDVVVRVALEGPDARRSVDDLHATKVMEDEDASWLRAMREAIAPVALADIPLSLCHGDVNASNILLPATPGNTVFLTDWAGHRSVAPLPHDETAEARIFWCQAQTRLLAARAHGDRDRIAKDMVALRAFAVSLGWT